MLMLWHEIMRAALGHPSSRYIAVVLGACVGWLPVCLTVALCKSARRH
jgi:hypothetical protein